MPLDPRQRPDDSEFSRYVEQMERVLEGAWQAEKKVDGMYFGTTDIWGDYKRRNPLDSRARPNFHSGEFAARVDQGVAAHLAYEPQYYREPVGEGAEHSAAAGQLEKGLQVVMADAFARVPNHPTRQNGKQMVLYNYTSLLVLVDTSGLRKPARRRGENKEDWEQREWEWISTQQHWNPIKLVVPTPGAVLMDPLKTNPDIMVWRRKMKANEVEALLLQRREQYKRVRGVLWLFKDAWVGDYAMKDADEDVEIEEWWSARWHGMRLKGGSGLYWEPNTLGIQPGLQVWGGTAISPVGEAFDVKWWVQQAMMYKVIDEIIMEAQTTVGHHELLQRAAWARVGTTADAGEAAEQMTHGLLQGNPDDWWAEKVPDLPAQSFQHKQNLEQSIERHTFPAMVAGFQKSEAETATGMVILSENTSRLFKAPVAKLEALHSAAGGHVLKAVYKLHQEYGDDFGEVGKGKAKLRVKDMEEQFHIQANFQQVDAVVEMQSRQQDLVLLEKGLISSEYFYAQHHIADPDGMRKEMYRDLMRRDPMYIEQGIINAFREDKMQEIADQRQAALDMAIAQRLMGQSASPGGSQQEGMVPGAGGPTVQMPPDRPVVGNGRPPRRMP